MPDPTRRTTGDELVRAADRDVDQLRYIEQLYGHVVSLLEQLGELETALVEERTARERLELRVYAHELRDAGEPLLQQAAGEHESPGCGVDAPCNVLPLIRDYAPDTEPLPT